MKPETINLPQTAQRRVKINQGNKLLFSALLGSTELAEVCTLAKRKQNDILAYEFITREHREKIELILFFNHEIILCVLCDLKKSINLGLNKRKSNLASRLQSRPITSGRRSTLLQLLHQKRKDFAKISDHPQVS